MKVLHVLESLRFGGIEKLIYDLVIASGHDPDVKMEVLLLKDKGEFRAKYKQAGIVLHHGYLKSGRDLSIGKIRNIVLLFKEFDLIHFHSFNVASAIAAISSGRKIIYTEHGLFKTGRKKRLNEYFTDPLKKIFLKRYTDEVIFISDFTYNYSQKLYRVKKPKSMIVYNGINPNFETFPGETSGLRTLLNNKFVVGTNSRLSGSKNIERLIQAFAGIADQEMILLIVGDGILRPKLENLCKQKGISDKVIFTGYKENVGDYLSLMDICIYPARNEAFGLVAVESLSMGKPTLVFQDGGGLVEIAREAEPENVVASVEELSGRILYYFNDRKAALTNKDKRINRARFFSIEKMFGEYKKAYLDLLK